MTTRGLLRLAGIVAGFGTLGIASGARAQVDAFWQNPLGGNWAVGANWSTNPDFPNNNGTKYNAFIQLVGPAYTVALDQDITIDDFTMDSPDATLDLTTFKLTMDFNFTQMAGTILLGSGGEKVLVKGDLLLEASLGDITLMGAGAAVTAEGGMTLDGPASAGIIICDIDVDFKGGAGKWTGGVVISGGEGASFNVGDGSTFTIENDQSFIDLGMGAAASFNNAGTVVKDGGTGTTTFQGVAFSNTGTLRISTGTLSTDGVDVNGNANTLSGGIWEVLAGSSLDLVGQTILKNAAIVRLSDAGSTFAALDSMTENLATGELYFENGRDFTTAGDFTNDGRLDVGAATAFTVAPGSSLTNYNGISKKLTGGLFDLEGTLKFDNAGISILAGEIILDGAGAAVQTGTGGDALAALATITAGGTFTITGGRNFTTGGDFAVVQTGLLRIDAGSLFRVAPGFALQNLVTGDFDDAKFDLQGLLQVDGASIKNIGTDLTLDGAGSGIIDENGNDALASLELIKPQGKLTLANGRDLNVLSTLVVQGELNFSTGPGDDDSILTIEMGDLVQEKGEARLTNGRIVVESGVYLQKGGSLTGEGVLEAMLVAHARVEPGDDAGSLAIAGPMEIGEDARLVIEIFGPGPDAHDVLMVDAHASFDELGDELSGDLRIVRPTGFVPAVGQFFDVMFWDTRIGEFATYHGMSLGASHFVPIYLPDRLRLQVVPAPSALALAGFAAVAGLRRRRN